MNKNKEEPGNIIHNMDEILKVAERFHTTLYASAFRQGETNERANLACDVLLVAKEVKNALKGTKTWKAAADDGINVDLLKEGGNNVL